MSKSYMFHQNHPCCGVAFGERETSPRLRPGVPPRRLFSNTCYQATPVNFISQSATCFCNQYTAKENCFYLNARSAGKIGSLRQRQVGQKRGAVRTPATATEEIRLQQGGRRCLLRPFPSQPYPLFQLPDNRICTTFVSRFGDSPWP